MRDRFCFAFLPRLHFEARLLTMMTDDDDDGVLLDWSAWDASRPVKIAGGFARLHRSQRIKPSQNVTKTQG